jgi:hypothetical protein
VLAVCSVRGLYRAFPPPDPPVYVRPQLKPSHGICSFTTTTFGTHRGADQGAGRSTSGRDLLCQLGGSTSASPPSTAGFLQLPGLTSTRPGWHTAVPDLHRHLRAGTLLPRAGIFMSWPTYVRPGSTSAFPRPAYNSPGRHIYFPAGIYVCGPEYSGSGLFGRNIFVLGRIRLFPASSGRLGPRVGRLSNAAVASGLVCPSRLFGPGWASIRAARPGFPANILPRLGRILRLPAGPASSSQLGHPGTPAGQSPSAGIPPGRTLLGRHSQAAGSWPAFLCSRCPGLEAVLAGVARSERGRHPRPSRRSVFRQVSNLRN